MGHGPMQIIVVGFEQPSFTGEILEELRTLREHDVIRMVDLLFVTKDEDGNVGALEAGDLSADEAAGLGALAGALLGFDAAGEAGALAGADGEAPLGDDVWYVADTIPPGTSAAIAVIEHRWAIGLRGAIERAGGRGLADAWLHPEDLAALGEHLPQP